MWIGAGGPDVTHYIDITDSIDRKIEALLCHKSQLPDPAGDRRDGSRLDERDRGDARVFPKAASRKRSASSAPDARTDGGDMNAMTVAHPLEMLTGDEIKRAVKILRESGRVPEAALFAHIVLHEPHKDELARWKPGDPVERRVRVVVVPGPGMDLHEVVVSVTKGEIVDWRDHADMRPTLLMTEAIGAVYTTKEHPEYIAALAKRGITNLDDVQIDPWPAGVFGYDCEDGRRITRCISFLRADPTDNGYARPIEGLIVHFDMANNEVIEVIDHGMTPLPPNPASYYAEDQPTHARGAQADLDHAARRRELHGRRQSRRLAELGVPHRLRPVRRARAPPDHLRRQRPRAARSCTARRSRRWSCPTATRASCTAGRTRSTRASGASAA